MQTTPRLRFALLLLATGAAGTAPAEEALPPSTVTITAPADDGYAVRESRAATKTETPLLETPMAVQVVPRAVLDDQQVNSIGEAIRNVSGVAPASYGFYDFVQIRGFKNS